jgi:radical SAM superfamily enzyme YgiQ (UPF0313 family)
VRAFFELYKERIGLPFAINSRVEVMNEEFCRSAAEAGCHTIWFGIESGDEHYRTTMLNRKMKNQQIIAAAENCKRAGINRLTFNIVGMPLETAENMRETLRLNQRIAPEFFFFFPYIPLRGTPLYEVAKKAGLLLENKKILHYLSAVNDRVFTLNMKEKPELLSAEEYNEICQEMLAFQERNNRLSYVDPDGDPDSAVEISVADKSLTLLEAHETVNDGAPARAADVPADDAADLGMAPNQKPSLVTRILGPFRSP